LSTTQSLGLYNNYSDHVLQTIMEILTMFSIALIEELFFCSHNRPVGLVHWNTKPGF